MRTATKKMILIGLFSFAPLTAIQAQLNGGGDLNPDLKAPAEAQEKFMDLRIGLSVHWGPSSIGQKEISWSGGDSIPREISRPFTGRGVDPIIHSKKGSVRKKVKMLGYS